MATGLDLVRMPGFEWGNAGRIDFSPMERAIQRHIDTQFRHRADEREGERIGLERERTGLQRDAFGLDQQRFGLQRETFAHQSAQDRARLEFDRARAAAEEAARTRGLGLQERGVAVTEGQHGLAREEQERQARERDILRRANTAWGIRMDTDPTRRAARLREWVARDPNVNRLLTQQGISLDGEGAANPDSVLDHFVAQVIDAQERFQPRPPTTVAPGTTIGRVTPEGGFTPMYTAPSTRTLSTDALRGMVQEGMQFSTLSRLSGTFNDRFTLPGVSAAVNAGDYANWFGRHMTGPPAERTAAAAWWQDYAANVDLIQRHALFGASLTPGEQASWRAATITPNMRPDLIRQHLQTRAQILRTGMARYGQTLILQGHDPNIIASAYGMDAAALTGATTPPPGGGQPGTGGPPSQVPARPASVPAGAGWSPSQQRWYTPDGRSFDAQGRPVQAQP